MNINHYRGAMDRIVPDAELKERIMKQTEQNHTRVPARRVLAGALAAVLTAACLATAAFAASPELRTAVLSFFRMEEHEQVPSSSVSPEGPNISNAEIGQLVKAQYIKMDKYYGMSGSLLNDLTWSEDHRTLLDYKFWTVENNELVPVQVDMHTNQIDTAYDGIRYQGELYWFVREGQLFLFQGSPHGIDTRPEDEWYVEQIPGRTDVILLKLAQGRQMDYSEYPVLYHLDTGEVADILSGSGADQLEYAYAWDWSEDMRRVFITCGDGVNGQHTWLCDLDSKTLTRLEELAGLDEEASASFIDNDTLILTTHTTSEEDDTWQTVTCYAYDISSGQKIKTLDQAHYYQWWEEKPYGAQLFGKRCVYITEAGQVQIVDLKTGVRTTVEGFTFQKGDEFSISPSGNKLLYFSMDPEMEGLGIAQLGVVDLEKGAFIAFDREGYQNLHEEGIGWDDDNTVSISARTPDGKTRYLLLYQF